MSGENSNLEQVDVDDDNRGNVIRPSDLIEEASVSVVDIEAHPYQRLTPDCVIDAVESTGRIADARILPLNSYENRVYQVGLEAAAPVVIKFYRPDRWSLDQIAEEHRFTQCLYDLDIPVVPPLIINPEGDIPTLSTQDEFVFAVYPRQGGRAPELDNLDHLHQLGQFIGRIHAAGRAFPLKYRIELSVKRFATDCVDFLLSNGFIPDDLHDAYVAITGELLAEIQANSPEQARYSQITLHGDCHPGNVLWRDDRPHFVDFDDVIHGPAIQDLWMLMSGDTAARQKQLVEIIEGYEMFMAFDLAELRLIEPLRALRLLHYNAWLARRWSDPAFPASFPWFNTPRYWSEHILECKELLSALQEPPLSMPLV